MSGGHFDYQQYTLREIADTIERDIARAMASLFACSKQNVSYHLSKIFSSGELDQLTVVKEILTTVQSGVRGLSDI